uniref:RAS and EF-hand domain-containing-like protein n=1 Tax=Magallana gigas TaxID=29159 RepID=K1Q7W3_MAGGI
MEHMEDIPSAEEMEVLAKQKSHELFALCDTEEKGFITKRDMQRLQTEIGLDPEQLEAVFDSLDDDKNGYLTLEEFTSGFGSYLGIAPSPDDNSLNMSGGDHYEEDMMDKAEEEEKQFNNMMESIGADRVIDDRATVKTLWMKIRHDEPELMSNFEDFLYKITNDIQRARGDFESLESALKSKNTAHDQEIQKLYEEMEYQIKQEKERILTEEQLKERQMRESMEEELKEKDRQLQDLLAKHQEMEKRMSDLNQTEVETKLENDKLMKEKEALEEMLQQSQESLEESKSYIGQLRSQQKDEKRERARGRMDSTKESISEFSNDEDLEESPPHHHSLHDITDITDDIECDDEVISHQHTQSLDHVDSHYGIGTQRERHKQHKRQRKKAHKATVDENRNGIVPESPRGQPVGEDKTDEEVTPPPRQRLFKVVFVGDSGVGKSSFIHRFCNDQFNPTFSATIGVDFQVKSIVMEGQVIVLQLWDTAGQERFRSITKQYFRKADGVILMYDVTTEATFTNVRNWITSIQEGVEEGTALVLVGNKTDLIEEQDRRAVKVKDGNKLAAEYDASFFEVSAKSGTKVKECMESLARILKEKEDDEIEKALHLEDGVKKKKGGCCS